MKIIAFSLLLVGTVFADHLVPDTTDAFLVDGILWVNSNRSGSISFVARNVSFREVQGAKEIPLGKTTVVLQPGSVKVNCLQLIVAAITSGTQLAIRVDENKFQFTPGAAVNMKVDIPEANIQNCGLVR